MQMKKISSSIFLALLVYLVDGERTDCRNPSSLRKLERGLRTSKLKDLPESFYLMENLRNNKNISEEYSDRLYINLDQESTECPRTLENGMDLCPGYKVMEYDRFRKPYVMLQVHCKCTNCIGLNKRCQPLYYYTRVLRVTGCNERGVYNYDYYWERVSNGCVCRESKPPTLDD
ncbi:interleukin 17-like protein [Crassostrea virginica]|uniref:Interleukin 17-like protein n=1 Tax=Crassostrea virginica TaxID=6565 RepID=A0A8B8EWU6_CRAVI|nr:interleukin 17-like protein [Crassostrea virginica]